MDLPIRRAYVLNRDNYTCQYCKGKAKDSKLDVHHIIFRCYGGSRWTWKVDYIM